MINNLLEFAAEKLESMRNRYIVASGRVQHQQNVAVHPCGLNIPKGDYLVLGSVQQTIGSEISSSASIVSDANVIVVMGQGRIISNNGGGCHTWAIVSVPENQELVKLFAFSQSASSFDFIGHLVAIKLI